MSEASKSSRKKSKLPDNVANLPDKEVAKLLFGKKGAAALEKEIADNNSKPDKK